MTASHRCLVYFFCTTMGCGISLRIKSFDGRSEAQNFLIFGQGRGFDDLEKCEIMKLIKKKPQQDLTSNIGHCINKALMAGNMNSFHQSGGGNGAIFQIIETI